MLKLCLFVSILCKFFLWLARKGQHFTNSAAGTIPSVLSRWFCSISPENCSDQQHSFVPCRSLSLEECDSHAQALPSLKEKFPWNDVNSPFTYFDDPNSPTWFERQIYNNQYNDCGSESSAGYLDVNGNHRTQEERDALSRNSARPRTRSAGVALTRDRQRIADDKGGDTDAEEDRTIAEIRRKTFHRFTSAGFKEAMRKGKGMLKKIGDGKYVDKNGVILSVDGPFWPQECGPLYPKPDHIKKVPSSAEPLFDKGKNYLILLYFLCPCAYVCVFVFVFVQCTCL